MNTPQIFNFEKYEVRTVLVGDEPYFVGKDVADVLGYERSDNAVRSHVDEEDKLTHQISASGQSRNMTIINESGLYSLILKSKLPSAKKFKRWVTSEVLPAIRKHGGYLTQEKIEEALLNPDTIIQLATTLKQEREKVAVLEQQVAEYEPKIGYLDMILATTDTVATSQIAADYGLSAIALNRLLHDLGVQHKVGKQWLLYKKHMNQGYTKSETTLIPMADGTEKAVMNTKWTQKGRIFIYELLKKHDYFPQLDLEIA
ncbi:phage antirepressor [Enterococcus asini]|uniref:phage antirepressor n=1 Tax=Enterococcus asini TaxID=57732 RepID=UPI00288F62B8|nr:phage antirepressor [Enterococcus asini]MDT2743975.1 phage antirepressor [Enterococcus asini]